MFIFAMLPFSSNPDPEVRNMIRTGSVAYEMARQLESSGEEVALLAILDATADVGVEGSREIEHGSRGSPSVTAGAAAPDTAAGAVAKTAAAGSRIRPGTGPDAIESLTTVAGLLWFLALASGAALLLSALGTDLLRFLVGAAFEDSRFIVPFSAFSYVMYGAYTIGATGLSIVGRSSLVAATMGAAAVLSVVLNLLVIPPLGMYGAALSTVAGYLTLALLTGVVSQRHYPVPWQLGRAAATLAIAAGLSATALAGPDDDVQLKANLVHAQERVAHLLLEG